MTRFDVLVVESELRKFANMAHEARFPAYMWRAVACDMMGLPVGSRPTPAQMIDQPNHSTTLWLELTMRFDNLSTVRWAEHVECEEERFHNALVHLGASPDIIAKKLALMGVTGDKMECRVCPLYHYFTGIHGAWFAEVVATQSVVEGIKVSNSLAVQQFVRQFDAFRFPELDPFADRKPIE